MKQIEDQIVNETELLLKLYMKLFESNNSTDYVWNAMTGFQKICKKLPFPR